MHISGNIQMRNGLIHIYTGEGKGKTTAAIGLSVRAKSRRFDVLFAQFFKEGGALNESGLLHSLGIDSLIFSKVKSPLFHPRVSRSVNRREAKSALLMLRDIFTADTYDVVILDEFVCLIAEGILSEEEALEFILQKPKRLELILTGRGATDRMIASAHYVTYMTNVKHPYRSKIRARKGIEF